MANTIGLAQNYLVLLDEVYQVGALTSILDAPPMLVREGMNYRTIHIPQIAMDGLGDYSPTTGFVNGNVTFTWVSYTFSQNRGRKFVIDLVEDMETINQVFVNTAAQFMRTKVIPEIDAYRLSTIAAQAQSGNIASPGDLTAATALEAIDTGMQIMADNEVGMENMVIFISNEVKTHLKQSDQIERNFQVQMMNGMVMRNIMGLDGVPVVPVPRGRFYTNITLQDGTTSGQESGGFVKNATTGRDINFMIVDKAAVFGIKKIAVPRVFDANTYQDAHATAYDFHLYHDMFVFNNKRNGIYLHNKTS